VSGKAYLLVEGHGEVEAAGNLERALGFLAANPRKSVVYP